MIVLYSILGYLLLGCVLWGAIGERSRDYALGFFIGFFWPIVLPMVFGAWLFRRTKP